jgi:catechol 2,3-dioxygenase-like lactoylglutathione lyase family enzyme
MRPRRAGGPDNAARLLGAVSRVPAMIDHLEILVSDLPRSAAFFRAALAPLGYALRVEGNPTGFGAPTAAADLALDFWIKQGGPSTPRPHFAFTCASRAQVEEVYRAALAAGGIDNGAPRTLAHIHPSYYAAFVRDPDGHNVELVCHVAE